MQFHNDLGLEYLCASRAELLAIVCGGGKLQKSGKNSEPLVEMKIPHHMSDGQIIMRTRKVRPGDVEKVLKEAYVDGPKENTSAPSSSSETSAPKSEKESAAKKPVSQKAGKEKTAESAGGQADKAASEPAPIKGKIEQRPGMYFVDGAANVPAWITEQTGPIPPAWRYIQVAENEDADLLVTAYDSKGRQQSKYSAAHTQRQAMKKFDRVEALRQRAPEVEEGIRGIKKPDVRDCLLLIMKTGLRPGSTESAKTGHYGATTLTAEHVVNEGRKTYLRFVGKEGVQQDHEIKDPELKKMLRKRKREAEKTEDKRLFRTSTSTLNEQLKVVTGSIDISVKDLRTLKACTIAYDMLSKRKPVKQAGSFNKLRNEVGDAVCRVLGNGRTMALGSYIDPRLFAAHSPDGFEAWKKKKEKDAEARKKKKEQAA